jgi:RNA polymerase sigma factor (sigma-70 family)
MLTLERKALAGCLAQLQDKSRQLLALKYVDQLSIIQIAERLQKSQGAIMTTLSRLRAALRECAQRALGHEGVSA